MDILDQYFGEEMQKYMPKFELGTVYSDPYASAFRKIEEGPSTKKLRIFDFDDTLAKVKANIIVKNKDKEFTLTPAEFAVYVPKNGDSFNFKEFNAMIKTAAPIKKNIELLKQAFDQSCVYCGSKEKLTIDHIIPLARDGTHDIANLLPCCKSCNSSKNCSPVQSWYRSKPFFSEQRWEAIVKFHPWLGIS